MNWSDIVRSFARGGRTPQAYRLQHYSYDEQGHLVGEYDAMGALIQETVWLDDLPVATLRPKSGGGVDVFYVHTDHLSTPRLVTRPSDNAVVWRWDTDPFGQAPPNENPSALGTFSYNLRFPGQYYDVESGFHYNHHRDYDPATGRYVQSDPIGIGGGLNTYAYAEGAPQRLTDPMGLAVDFRPPNEYRTINTTCCKDGIMTICMNSPGLSNVKCKVVMDSVLLHENAHLEEMRAKAPKICTGVKGTRGLGFTTWTEWKLSELNAFNVQWDFLNRQLNKNKNACLSPNCEVEIADWMNKILNEYIPKIINETY